MARLGGIFPLFMRNVPQAAAAEDETLNLSATLTGLSGTDIIVQPRRVSVIVERGAALTDLYMSDGRKIGVTEGRAALVATWEAAPFSLDLDAFTLDDGNTSVNINSLQVVWYEEYAAGSTTLVTEGNWTWILESSFVDVGTNLND